MSYNTQAQLANDGSMSLRVAACAATQGIESPTNWAGLNMWKLSAEPGWDAAYSYAILSNSPDPGHEEGVITDAMILSAVQKLIAAAAAV